ncbi:MAG: hypothetical protein ACJ780_28655 [Solirubrobacteraceae bacterium]
MSDHDWALAQGTVDFRNEERRATNGSEQIPPTGPRARVQPLCPTCLVELDETFFCSMCGRLETSRARERAT